MPFYDQYGNELVAFAPAPSQGEAGVLVEQRGGPQRQFGSVTRRRRVFTEYVLKQAANSAAATWYYSAAFYVDFADELLLVASLDAASSGTPANFQMKLQVSDDVTSPITSSFIDHPAGVLPTVTSPGIAAGPICAGSYTAFGDLVRVGVQWGTAWGGAQNIRVIAKAKS